MIRRALILATAALITLAFYATAATLVERQRDLLRQHLQQLDNACGELPPSYGTDC